MPHTADHATVARARADLKAAIAAHGQAIAGATAALEADRDRARLNALDVASKAYADALDGALETAGNVYADALEVADLVYRDALARLDALELD